MDVSTGRLLDGRYRLGPPVGRGGMATVHAATDTLLGRAVAIKFFMPPADEVMLARLATEAGLLARLSHPGLLRVFDVSTSAAQPYLVMQLVSGCTLRTLINRGPVVPAQVALIGVRLAETLHYVHSRQIVHRDIKPSNVLLADDACYLADFGIAKAVGAARLTSTGHCVGTAAYLAPEQVAGAGAGPAADIYALGLVLLECLTGEPEYSGTEAEAALARLTRPPRIPGWLPPSLHRALTAMTARNPDDRPDAAACAELLAGHPAADPVRPPSADPAPNPTKILEIRPPRRRLVQAGLGVAVAAGLAGAALTLFTTTGSGTVSRPAPEPVPTSSVPVVAVPPQTAEAVVAGPPPAQPQAAAKTEEKKPAKKKGGGHGR